MRAAKRTIEASPAAAAGPSAAGDKKAAAASVPKVVVRLEDLLSAIEALQPSLSEEELARYAALQQGFRSSALGGGGHQHRA